MGDSARLFALATMAMADAAITAWDSKREFNFWRPITAIQEGDNDLNPRTVGDPTWLPLIPTPPYPDYTSGANNLSGAATRMLHHFFGTDQLTFSLTSNTPQAIQKTRTYSVSRTRLTTSSTPAFIWASTSAPRTKWARKQGEHVANWVFGNFLKPLADSQ